jgi:hypothetical protein
MPSLQESFSSERGFSGTEGSEVSEVTAVKGEEKRRRIPNWGKMYLISDAGSCVLKNSGLFEIPSY